jgi:MscS family membrane protein
MTRAARTLLPLLLVGLALAAAGGTSPPAAAQAPPAPAGPPPAAQDAYGRSTPRGAVEGFAAAARARDWPRAALYLDLRGRPAVEVQAEGPRLARWLAIVLRRKLVIDTERLADLPAGQLDDGLPPSQDRVGHIRLAGGETVEILLQRGPDAGGSPVWRVAPSTVARVPGLYAEFGEGPLAEVLPAALVSHEFLGAQAWEWLALPAALVLAFGVAFLATAAARWLLRRRPSPWSRALEHIFPPFRALVALLAAAGLVGLLQLTLLPPAAVLHGLRLLLVPALAWLALRLVDVVAAGLLRPVEARGDARMAALGTVTRRGVKAVLVVAAVLAMLAGVGINVTAVVAGLGVGSLAVALAAQKTVENLIGGVALYTDEPVRIGDFCAFGADMGLVEEIGLRSTRVRTLQRGVLTVPNAEFSNLRIHNLSRRDRFLFNPRLGLRYETTPDQLRFVLVELRQLLYAHPAVDPDPARVRFAGFGAHSLDVEVFAYVRTSGYDEYLAVAEDLNLRVLEAVARAGAAFAFPSQTTYLARAQAPDTARVRAAEEAVAAWRARGALPLPGFDAATIAGLAGTLDYPPRGSVAARGAGPA